MLTDDSTTGIDISGASGAKFAFDLATKLAGLYISWKTGKENEAQMNRLIALNEKQIELLEKLQSFATWQSSVGLISDDLVDISAQYDNVTKFYTETNYNEFIGTTGIDGNLSTALTTIRNICVDGFEGNQTKPLHEAFLDYIRSEDIDHSERYAVSVYKYYIANLYYQGAFLKTLLFKESNTPQSEIDEWSQMAQGQLKDIQDAFETSIENASSKYKTLENVESPFKLYTKEAHADPNPTGDKYYYTLENQKIAIGETLMADDDHVIVGIKMKKTEVDLSLYDDKVHGESKSNLGIEITTVDINDLVNINSETTNPETPTKHHENITFDTGRDHFLGTDTAGFANKFVRLPDLHVLTGIQFVRHSIAFSKVLGVKLYSRKLSTDDGTLATGDPTETTKTVEVDDITTFESLPNSESEPAKADSGNIQPGSLAVITGVCIIKRDHCIQFKLETQDWRSLL